MTLIEIKTGSTFVFESDDHMLEAFYLEPDPKFSWMDPFQIWFNGTLYGYKTFKAFEKKFNQLVEKYHLKEV